MLSMKMHQVIEKWRNDFLSLSASFHATMIDGCEWHGRVKEIGSNAMGERLYELTKRLERRQYTKPSLVPVPYRLAYAAAVVDKLDGGCRLARHLALAERSVERQKQSLHSLFPSKYGPYTGSFQGINDAVSVAEENAGEDYDDVSAEQMELNGECCSLIFVLFCVEYTTFHLT